MNNEQRMWIEQLRQLSPGWEVAPSNTGASGAALLANDVFLYLLDTSTLWMAAGATTQRQMGALGRRTLDEPQLARDAIAYCATTILESGSRQLTSDCEMAKCCLMLSVCAMAQTNTWSKVEAAFGGALAGHWLYLAYRTNDGGAVGRPVYLRRGGGGFIPAAELPALALRAVLADSQRGSRVGQRLAEAGGAVLHPSLRVCQAG